MDSRGSQASRMLSRVIRLQQLGLVAARGGGFALTEAGWRVLSAAADEPAVARRRDRLEPAHPEFVESVKRARP